MTEERLKEIEAKLPKTLKGKDLVIKELVHALIAAKEERDRLKADNKAMRGAFGSSR